MCCLQLEVMIKGYVEDLTSGGVHLGDTLENSLELGEKHEAFIAKCKSVSNGHITYVCMQMLWCALMRELI